ncbi:MAG TPA: cytochrome c [Burkholderiales bacterium]|nr:cytochrome c [Burkholderiales bacterium]
MRLLVAGGLALLLASPPAARADDLGRRVFTQIAQPSCALCHTLAAAGAAGTLGPSLDELKPDKERALQVLRNGSGVMPPFADKLTPEQIEAVAVFIAKAAGSGASSR